MIFPDFPPTPRRSRELIIRVKSPTRETKSLQAMTAITKAIFKNKVWYFQIINKVIVHKVRLKTPALGKFKCPSIYIFTYKLAIRER